MQYGKGSSDLSKRYSYKERKRKMNKKKMLEEILQENKQVNRNLLHLGNLIGLLILMEGMKEGKRRRDKGMVGLAKFGFFLLSMIEVILTIFNVQELYAKYKEEKEEEEELWS